MSHHELLTSVRTIYVLAAKPGRQTSGAADYWAMPLSGLHRDDLHAAVTTLRKQRLSSDSPEATKRSLKPLALYDTLAQALGAKDYDDWIRDGGHLSRIVSWLADKGMQHPRDLIRWDRSPRMAGKLTARQVSDRLFNSRKPLTTPHLPQVARPMSQVCQSR
ncbi:MAG: hypothetical protein CFE43_09125 [Burkholderiales bacterium PBB3]|nr:MAG: hypothetical protein CFE43_09125 [Burkholderiales bacterium PBB3]